MAWGQKAGSFRNVGNLHPTHVLYHCQHQYMPANTDKTIFADKAYRDNNFREQQRVMFGNEILTPIKAVKGASEQERQRNKAADELYSAAVSSVREPVEAFFG